MSQDTFIPNSYQTPNAYCDRLMYLLTPSEWKVLSYAVRRIFGFQKRQDNISLSQFIHGTVSTIDGEHLDHGTGLSKPTVIACLDNLMRYKLITKLADNDPLKNEGDLYALQLEYDNVDYAGLIERANARSSADLQRTAQGRNSAEQKRRSIPLGLPGEVVNGIDRGVVNGIDRGVVNGIDRGWSMGLTRGGQSDRPGVVNGIDTQYTEEIQKETKRGSISHPDFSRACSILQVSHPSDYAAADPVLLEADEKPYRLHVRLNVMPPDFMAHLSDALREANPRRNYRLTYQTAGTSRAAQAEAQPDAPDPYAPTAEHLALWQSIVSELSFDVQPNTRLAYIEPARPISINGNWTIAVPSVEWWQNNMRATLKRIYKKLTGESTDFVFVESQR